jgi:tRNA A-37 threonylcarbamoyl transferase component Bud32
MDSWPGTKAGGRVTWCVAGMPEAWVQEVWSRLGDEVAVERFEQALPGLRPSAAGADPQRAAEPAPGNPLHVGPVAVVKIVRTRPAHSWLRRLRASRCVHEGRGYQAYARRGLRTPNLVAYGEERRRGLFVRGFVATQRVAARTVAEACAERPDASRLFATAEELAILHRAGVCHGDPRLRNFLDTRPRPLALDLASWSSMSHRALRQDVIRFVGSVLLLTKDPGLTAQLQDAVTRGLPALPAPAPTLLEEARRWSETKDRP